MDTVNAAAELIARGEALLITAGAGMGVDSGLPDFRGDAGFWRAYPAAAQLGLSFEQLANPAWFEKVPSLAWAFYGHRLNQYRQVIPHAGFACLLKWAVRKSAGYFVFTSNVDGQFQKAGFAADRLVECHGSIHHLQCTQRCTEAIWLADEEQVLVEEAAFRAREPLPKCQRCGGLARPNVLMFNDADWFSQRTDRQQEALTSWLKTLGSKSRRLVVVELGAGTAIPSVRYTSESVVAQLGGTLIRINPREPQVPRGHLGFALGAADALFQMDQHIDHREAAGP